MLKLHRLELSGFKSFVDPVKMDVASGLTAIVGPNGCGKSNIADAVVWVLGERSAKSLRGEKMEDVIFGGAKGRKPLGMAEVSLELLSDNGFPGADDGRLTIGRRLFRSGESQYLVNGKRVRLKDVKGLLMDTGLGVRDYSMIEQGKIGQILSGKPQERRRLLEEAAGVTHYRDRRRLAEIKLEEARANLARLDDIVSEVERALRSLKRQANAARRYKKRQAEYRDLLRQVLEGRWRALQERLAGFGARLAEMTAREAELTATLHREEAAFTEGREELDRLARQLAERHSLAAELAATIEGKQEFLKGSRQRLQELGERVAAGRAGAAERESRLETLRRSLDEMAERRRGLAEERDRAASEVTEDETRISLVEKFVGEAENRLEALRGRLLASINDSTGLRNRLHREQLETEKGGLRRAHLAEELARKGRELEEAAATARDAEAKLRALERRADAKQDLIGRHQGDLSSLLDRKTSLAATHRELDGRVTGLRRRHELLTELGERHEERRRALREALALAGVERLEYLSDRLQVPEGWARSLDLFLGELEDAVVLPPGQDALALAGALAAGRGTGRLLSPRTPTVSFGGGDPSPLDDPAVRTPLGRALGLPDDIAAALPPAYLVDTPADAERLARRHPGVAFLSRDGMWAQSGILHVRGAQAKPGLLARGRELAGLADELPPLGERLAEVVADLEELDHQELVHRSRIRQFEQELADLNQELAVARARHEDAAARHRRLGVERQTLETECGEIDRELSLLSDRAARLAEEVGRGEALHAELEAAFDAAQAEVADARGERETTRTTGASRRGRLELLQERLDAHDQEAARLEREIEENRRQLASWSEESERLAERRREIETAMKAAETELQEALERRAASQEDVLAQQARLDEKKAEIAAVEQRMEAAREQRDALRAEMSELRVDQAGLKQDAEHLAASFREEFHEEPAGKAVTGSSFPTQPDRSEVRHPPDTSQAQGKEEPVTAFPAPSLDELEVDLARCKEVLERLGPVNLLAAEEYEEQEERYKFLTEQRTDVADSVTRLKQTIREINETSSERFRQTFEEVNRHFREVFVQLFRGGEAEMRLLDESDVLESVIEIVARPPGKRLQNLMLMSGGEKALTAIALLFSLFRTKPSPFCILDEVDAPLDDVNTLRFVELVKTMAGETQFIIITHNKLTMEAAGMLYGVTMQERGVSSLVSVELDDVQPEPQAAIA